MKIIISPAKKIDDKRDFDYKQEELLFDDETRCIYDRLRSLTKDELKELYKASDKITDQMYDIIHRYTISDGYISALLAYDGIQYQYMNPSVFDDGQLAYIDKHLLIVSGLYGLLRPFSKIIPYRLEMQSKLKIDEHTDLYQFWNAKLAKQLEGEMIINLASSEYSKAILPYINKDQIIDIYFKDEVNGKYVQKGLYAKMARGLMVKYMATNAIEDIDDIKKFDDMGYHFNEELSNSHEFIFTRKE